MASDEQIPAENADLPHWRYGPTSQDPDPGKVWCDDCGEQVYFFSEGAICSAGCPSMAGADRW